MLTGHRPTGKRFAPSDLCGLIVMCKKKESSDDRTAEQRFWLLFIQILGKHDYLVYQQLFVTTAL